MAKLSDSAGPLNVDPQQTEDRLGPAFLVYFHAVICCLSLLYVGQTFGYAGIAYDGDHIYDAILNVIPFVLVSILFTFARFSFGYFIGFYLYTMILGFLWLVGFSKLGYDREVAAFSAAASAVAFLIPTLFIVSPIGRRDILSVRTFDNLLTVILIASAMLMAVSALDNFRFVDLLEASNLRSELVPFPLLFNYLIPVTQNALLPVIFACFVVRRHFWQAAAVIVLLLFFYPITLTKSALFAPFWILAITLLSKKFEARTAVVVSLFVPVLVGVVLMSLVKADILSFLQIRSYFGLVNFRMVAIPSAALDFYAAYFATHDLTYFCQISFLKPYVNCPYRDPLSIVMYQEYKLGNFNASLFATEGIASVGPVFAPIVVLLCGLILSLGNRVSADLPPRFVLMSSAMIPEILLNVPLTTSLLSNGIVVLFLMWHIVPRAIFEKEQQSGLIYGSPADIFEIREIRSEAVSPPKSCEGG
jgi:hypothetical protein